MIYSMFADKELPLLGFGTMRLPTLPDGSIDAAATQEMVDCAMANGVNYFDTAYPYHGGNSELVIGQALKKYPRDSFYLATKYPGHQIASTYDPAEIFEDQLKKCQVEYFDFYLLHNVSELCLDVYEDAKWGIIDYFVAQKKAGRIKHLGFSSHGSLSMMADFLSRHYAEMEFCQIQLNYIDWTLQQGAEKCQLLGSYGIPTWVMEPVRGGKLAALPAEHSAALHAARPDHSDAAWAFRFLQDIPGVKVILSGMSNMAQMQENIATFSDWNPLTPEEKELLLGIGETMADALPCTGCRYCTDGCPMELDIPTMINAYNDIKFDAAANAKMLFESMPEDKQPECCIACGACTQICPQKIDIPTVLADLAERLKDIPSWREISRQREEARLALKAQQGK